MVTANQDKPAPKSDLETCTKCGGAMRVITTTTRRERVRYRRCLECGHRDRTREQRRD